MVVAYVVLIVALLGAGIHADTTDNSIKSTELPSEDRLNETTTVSVNRTTSTYIDASHESSSPSPKSSANTLTTLSSSTFPSEATVSASASREPEITSSATLPVNTPHEPQVSSTPTTPANASQQPEVISNTTATTTPVNTSAEPQVTSPVTVPANTSREPQAASSATVTQNLRPTAMDILNNTRTTTEPRTTAKVSNVTNITEPEVEPSAQANVTTSFQSTEFLTKESGAFTTDVATVKDMATSTSEKQGRRRYSKSAIIATVISVVVLLIGLVGMGLWFYNVRYRLHQRDRPILRDAEVDNADNPFSIVYYQNDGNEEVMLHKQ